MSNHNFEPRIIGFFCNWCTYAAADTAGVSRMRQPSNVDIVRVMCTGRVDPAFVLKAFAQGADGVLVSGCHPGDCHYLSGNLIARRKFALLKNFLSDVGIEPARVQFSWVSASEGERFARIVEKVTNEIKKLGPMTKLVKTK